MWPGSAVSPSSFCSASRSSVPLRSREQRRIRRNSVCGFISRRGLKMDYIEINGTSLRYDLRGTSGPILVMIHEMGGMIENWDEVMPRFAQGFRVLRYDTRGCGL